MPANGHLAAVYFGMAERRHTPDYVALRSAVRPCNSWKVAEGRLTEYLRANATPVRSLALPFELAGGTLLQERTLSPMLLAGDKLPSPKPLDIQRFSVA